MGTCKIVLPVEPGLQLCILTPSESLDTPAVIHSPIDWDQSKHMHIVLPLHISSDSVTVIKIQSHDNTRIL